MVGRKHWCELEDLSSCPKFLREGVTDCLEQYLRKMNVYNKAVPILIDVLKKLRCNKVFDLCSGSGGPWMGLLDEFERKGYPVELTLSDKYPDFSKLSDNRTVSSSSIQFCNEPVDATQPSIEEGKFTTFFTSFHHFDVPAAKSILQDAVDHNRGIAIFEFTERTVLTLLLMVLVTPFVYLLLTPFMRPYRLSKLVFTYLVPIIPIGGTWDGIVSCLRTYSPDELKRMSEEVSSETYKWIIGRKYVFPSLTPITYLIGYPGNSKPIA